MVDGGCGGGDCDVTVASNGGGDGGCGGGDCDVAVASNGGG